MNPSYKSLLRYHEEPNWFGGIGGKAGEAGVNLREVHEALCRYQGKDTLKILDLYKRVSTV